MYVHYTLRSTLRSSEERTQGRSLRLGTEATNACDRHGQSSLGKVNNTTHYRDSLVGISLIDRSWPTTDLPVVTKPRLDGSSFSSFQRLWTIVVYTLTLGSRPIACLIEL